MIKSKYQMANISVFLYLKRRVDLRLCKVADTPFNTDSVFINKPCKCLWIYIHLFTDCPDYCATCKDDGNGNGECTACDTGYALNSDKTKACLGGYQNSYSRALYL